MLPASVEQADLGEGVPASAEAESGWISCSLCGLTLHSAVASCSCATQRCIIAASKIALGWEAGRAAGCLWELARYLRLGWVFTEGNYIQIKQRLCHQPSSCVLKRSLCFPCYL